MITETSQQLICPQHIINLQVSNALYEDSLVFPDYTANLVEDNIVSATITAKEGLILCGKQWVNQAFLTSDKCATILWNFNDGDSIKSGTIICQIVAKARSILTSERTALNFLQTLSGTATTVKKYVDATASTKVKIMDTRKTIPGLRYAQKYAVSTAGGYNQRVGLYDGVLIKENHIASCGGIKKALQQAFLNTPKHIPIQIEVENTAQLSEALDNGAKLILLDNMNPTQIKECVSITNGRAELEASGNIDLTNVLEYAQTGVNRISIGGLTKNITAIDLSLRIYSSSLNHGLC